MKTFAGASEGLPSVLSHASDPPHMQPPRRLDARRAFNPHFGRPRTNRSSDCNGFKTDTIFIIGSQGILLAWPDAPALMRASPEIDAFPANAKIWEIQEKAKHPDETPEASEHIDALFGSGSQFHRTHGFYIDGVDENTARLPPDWQNRAIIRRVDVGEREVVAVAPWPEDLIVSKLARLDDKDKAFIAAYHSARPIDPNLIEERVRLAGFGTAQAELAIRYVRDLTSSGKGSI